MDKIPRADFEKWAKEQHWLRINETPNPNGRQDTYICPSGNACYVIFDLQSNLMAVIKIVPSPPQQAQGFRFPGLQKPFMGQG